MNLPTVQPVIGLTPEARAWLQGATKKSYGLDLVAGVMTLIVIAVLAMAFGFLIMVTKAFLHWVRR